MTEVTYLLPVTETLSAAWEKVKGIKGSIWVAIILYLILYILLEAINLTITPMAPSIQGLPDLIIELLMLVLRTGIIYIGILHVFDRPYSFRTMFSVLEIKMALKIIGSYFLQAIILIGIFLIALLPMGLASSNPDNNLLVWLEIAGFVIAIAIMIYLGIRMYFAVAFVVERGAWPWESIKLSFQITRGNFWRLFVTILLSWTLILISAIPLGVGLIWSLPWYYVLYGLMYKNLMFNLIATNTTILTKTI